MDLSAKPIELLFCIEHTALTFWFVCYFMFSTQDSDEVHQEDLDILREMFPDASTTELVHCLGLSGGDLENTALWVLHRQEMEESLAQSSKVSGT